MTAKPIRRLACAAALLWALPVSGQDTHALATRDGTHTIRFPARAGVCGDGETIVRQRPGGGRSMWMMRFGGTSQSGARPMDDLASWCRPGPVTVTFERRAGTVERLDVAVGGDAPEAAVVDLPAETAVTLLVENIAGATSGDRARTALHAAVLANAESWPALLALVRDTTLPASTRRSAHAWLATEASERVLAEAGPLDDAQEVRRHAVFALSRRRDATSRAALWELTSARTEPAIRSAAVFWAGQDRDDPRVLELFETVLRRR